MAFRLKGWIFPLFKVGHGNVSFWPTWRKQLRLRMRLYPLSKEVVAQAHKEFKKMKKNDRLELIRKIVQENKITTQGELVKLLQNEGLKATQATVSRDINEIGITKVPSEDGSLYLWAFKCPRRLGVSPVGSKP